MLNIYIKGILLGIANIIPGISGGTLALILKIYYKIINSISEILKLVEIKKNLMFLTILTTGMLTSILLTAKIFKAYAFDNGRIESLLIVFFIGLTFGNMLTLKNEISIKTNNINEKILKYLLFFIGVAIIILFLIIKEFNIHLQNKIPQEKNSIKYYFLLISSGTISGASMILPGISGSAMLLLLGFYKEIILIISEFNIILIVIFTTAATIGIITAILIIKKIIDNHLNNFIYLSKGLIFGSILQMILILVRLNFKINFTSFISLGTSFTLGILINKKMAEKCK
ncbi:membrane protein [Borreliella chilensis]|uniref:Membrane protein n=1 Tax=Borreliella chilensis TaxID=1245910 RepID=A0A0A7UWT8_9SPIR|nr:membrane protein [Borreliella chilensis]